MKPETVVQNPVKQRKPLTEKQKKYLKLLGIILGIVVLLAIVFLFLIYPHVVFATYERKLEDAAKRYYEVNYNVLKKDGFRTLTYEELYDQKYIEELQIPFRSGICDLKSSWVKTDTEDGKTTYYVYLQCGKIGSNIDHVGPVITLNGQETVEVEKGSTYEDAGVKEVVDAVDGKMEITDVTIDNKVDTSKVGTYTVTYKAKDKLHNEGKVVRTVNVIQSLQQIVKTDTNNLNYYQGQVTNNYVLFSGMLWRIVGLNEDEGIKLITDQPVGSMSYVSEDGTFENSDLKDWLNNYFYQHLNEDSKEYLVSEKWCADTISDLNVTTCSSYTEKEYKVGTLSLQEYNLAGGTWITSNGVWLLNRTADNDLVSFRGSLFHSSNMVNSSQLYGVRPMVVLKKGIKAISGNGTEENPYRLGDYETAKRSEKLTSRLVGEHVTYSGFDFMITDIDASGVTAIMNGSVDLGEEDLIKYSDEDEASIYDPTTKGNVGYQVEVEGKKYVSTKLLQKQEIEVPIYDDLALYGQQKETKTYTVYLAAPQLFTMFSNMPTDRYYSFWYRDSSKNSEYRYQMLYDGNIFHYIGKDMHADIRVQVKFQQDVEITGGEGTQANPYTIG